MNKTLETNRYRMYIGKDYIIVRDKIRSNEYDIVYNDETNRFYLSQINPAHQREIDHDDFKKLEDMYISLMAEEAIFHDRD